jgi:hypothetical protein
MPSTISGSDNFNTSDIAPNVLAAIASASAGAVGTYAFLARTSASPITYGTTYAGSELRPIGLRMDNNSPTAVAYTGGELTTSPAGTWRAMGHTTVNIRSYTLFLRIS